MRQPQLCRHSYPTNRHCAASGPLATDSAGRIGISAAVTITNNNPPVAVDDSLEVPMNATSDLNVLANDIDPNGNALVVTNVFSPTGRGTATITDGVLYYTPSNNVFGRDWFQYVIADIQARSRLPCGRKATCHPPISACP
jgi:hypothetical protein